MKHMKHGLAEMLLEKQKKTELRKQQMAFNASQHLDGVPTHDLADGEAVLVRHMMGGKGKGVGKSSGGLPYRAEEEGRDFARERETQYHNIATPWPSDDASGERLGDNHHSVRKALVEQAEDKKEAEAVTNTVRGSISSIFRGIWSEPKELTVAERWVEEEKDKKEEERRRQQEKREAREQRERAEQAKREEEYNEWLAQQPPRTPTTSPPVVETRGRPSQSASSGTRRSSTPRRSRSKKPPSDMGESSERERVRQAVFRQALAV